MFGVDDREKQEREARQAKEDLCALLNTGEGYRYVLRLVTALGACRCSCGEVGEALKNVAEQLLDDVAEANPQAYLGMMGQMRGIYTEAKNGW